MHSLETFGNLLSKYKPMHSNLGASAIALQSEILCISHLHSPHFFLNFGKMAEPRRGLVSASGGVSKKTAEA